MEKIFKYSEKSLDPNSLLNMNISNLTSTFMNGNITGKIFDSFKNRKFFDTSVLNKLNTLTELGNNNGNQTPSVCNNTITGYDSLINNTNTNVNVGNLSIN